MDKQSITDMKIPGVILMENAAIGIFREVVDKRRVIFNIMW